MALVTAGGLARLWRRPWRGALVLIVAAAWAAPARAGDTNTVLLPEVDTFIRVTDTARVFLLGSLTRNLTEATTQGALGVHLDLTLKPILRRERQDENWERDRYLWVRVGFRVSGNLEGPDSAATEYRGILEGTTRVPLFWDLWLVNRARVDLRDVGGDFSVRLRPRIGLERAFTLGITRSSPTRKWRPSTTRASGIGVRSATRLVSRWSSPGTYGSSRTIAGRKPSCRPTATRTPPGSS